MNHELHELFIKARQLHYDNQFPQAIGLYQDILKIDPQHQETLHFLGLAYAQSGDMGSALEHLLHALAIKPEAGLLNNLANVYKRTQQLDKAVDYYRQALSLEPNHAQAHNNLASIYTVQNKYQDALNHYVKATHAAPDFSAAHFNLGLLLLRNNELEAAKTQFHNVLSLNPQALEAQFYLGILHLESNALDEAEQAFQQVLEHDSEHVQTLVNLGVIALKRESNQLAIDYFSKALALDNEEHDARNNLAATFMHHDRFENALMHYDVLLKQEPNNIEYLYNSGVAQMALGHLNEATLCFDQVLAIEANHSPSLNNLAAIYLKLDMRETSRDYLQRALTVDPEDKISSHMLNAINGVTTAETTPGYAQNLFNNYALYYDQHMSGQLKYSLPTHIGKIIHQLPLLSSTKTLDLGCGTGLTGVVLRESSKHLTGIDIAEKMLAHANEKGIYDVLVQDELLSFLQHHKEHYDLIVAADVLPYFADLALLISLISQHLNANQYFIFSTEINETTPWKLETSARFSHQPDYIKQVLNDNSLGLIQREKVPGRIQNQLPLDIMLYVARKKD